MKKIYVIDRKFGDRFLGFCPIRQMGRVPEVDHVLVGHCAPDLLQHRQAANTGVKDPDRVRIVAIFRRTPAVE